MTNLHTTGAGDRWLVVVAHPDDESFGCGSVIAHAAGRGAMVTLACATRGDAGATTGAIAAGADLGEVREQELRAAAEILGVIRVAMMGYLDSGFDGPVPEGSLCAAPLAEVVGRIVDVVRRVHPDVVLVLDGSDGHRDHLRIRDAVRTALADHLDTDPTLYEHCLPNDLMRRWLEEMRTAHPDAAYHSLDPAALGRSDIEVTDTLDVGHVLDRREAAMAQHRSQTCPFDGLSPALRAAFLTRDHLVRVAYR